MGEGGKAWADVCSPCPVRRLDDMGRFQAALALKVLHKNFPEGLPNIPAQELQEQQQLTALGDDCMKAAVFCIQHFLKGECKR